MVRYTLLLLLSATSLFAQVTTTVIDGLRDKRHRLRAYTNCTAIPEPGVRIDNAVIIMRDDRIVSIGANAPIPAGADVRDLKGAWVYAGFVDPYVDVTALSGGKGDAPTPPWESSEDEGPGTPPAKGARHWNQAIHPEHRASLQLSIGADPAKAFTKLGITAAAVGTHDGIFQGTAAAVVIRPGTAATTIIEDNVYHGLSFLKGTSKTPYPSAQMGSIALIRQEFSDADWYGRAKAAVARNPKLPLVETNVAHEALRAALEANKTFVAHTQDEHDIQRWQLIAKEFPFNLAFRGTGLEYRRLGMVSATKPTIILPLQLPAVPDVSDISVAHRVSLEDLIHWYWAADNPRLLDSAGCRIAFTTDGLKDRSEYLSAIRTFVEHGLPRERALAAMTTNAASIAGIDNRCGKLASGYIANMVIADGDIFNDKTTIRTVIIAGDEHVQAPRADVDIRGHWTVAAVAGRTLRAHVSGEAERPTATFKADSIAIPGTFSVDNGRISFTLRTDTLGATGVARGTAVLDSILMQASVVMADGSTASVVFRRDSVIAGEPPAKPSKPEVRRGLPNWLPLGPFGRTGEPEQESVLLRNATVWTCSSDGLLQNADVLLQGGKIAGVGKGLVGAGTAIDATGMHITPGIIDEHSHIAISRGVNEGTHAVTTEVRIGDVLNPDDVNIYRQLSGGVTGTHLLHGSANPMGGQLQMIRMRWGADAEGLKFRDAAPTVKFALGENVKQSNWGDRFTVRYPQTRMGVEQIMRDAFRAAMEYERDMKAAAGDPTKLPVRRDIQLDALVEIVRGIRKIHCHSYVQSEILMLMRLCEEFGFRVHNFTHILEGYKVAEEMAKHGATASSFADWWAYKMEVYDAIPENPAIMHEQGVTVSINSDDAEMARRLNQESAKSVKYGNVTEEEAMKFPTINAAKQMLVADRTGSIEVGKDADIVLWTGNPLSNMSRVQSTWVEGRRYFDRDEDARMRVRDAELRRFLEQEAMKAIGQGAATAPAAQRVPREYHCEDTGDEVAGTGK